MGGKGWGHLDSEVQGSVAPCRDHEAGGQRAEARGQGWGTGRGGWKGGGAGHEGGAWGGGQGGLGAGTSILRSRALWRLAETMRQAANSVTMLLAP